MFPLPFHPRLHIAPPPRCRGARPAEPWTARSGAALRLAGLTAILSAAFSTGVSAQGTGTMQVTARVLPAAASWAALIEAREAVSELAAGPSQRAAIRRKDVLRTEAMILPADCRCLVVTIQHPYN